MHTAADVKGLVADGMKLTLTGLGPPTSPVDGTAEELELTADCDVERVLAFWKNSSAGAGGGGADAN